MIKVKVKELIWDEWNIEHIKKHNLIKIEVEEAVRNACAYKKSYNERILIIGRSKERILIVVLAKIKNSKYYVVTARDADKKERRFLYEKEREKNTKI